VDSGTEKTRIEHKGEEKNIKLKNINKDQSSLLVPNSYHPHTQRPIGSIHISKMHPFNIH